VKLKKTIQKWGNVDKQELTVEKSHNPKVYETEIHDWINYEVAMAMGYDKLIKTNRIEEKLVLKLAKNVNSIFIYEPEVIKLKLRWSYEKDCVLFDKIKLPPPLEQIEFNSLKNLNFILKPIFPDVIRTLILEYVEF